MRQYYPPNVNIYRMDLSSLRALLNDMEHIYSVRKAEQWSKSHEHQEYKKMLRNLKPGDRVEVGNYDHIDEKGKAVIVTFEVVDDILPKLIVTKIPKTNALASDEYSYYEYSRTTGKGEGKILRKVEEA